MNAPESLTKAAAAGLTVVLNDQGAPIIRGGHPPAALVEKLKLERQQIIDYLHGQTTEATAGGRWGEVPDHPIPYRHERPTYDPDDAAIATQWALRQPARVLDWLQRRALTYWERHPNAWPMTAYDHAALADLVKWQTGTEDLQQIINLGDD